MRVLANRWRPGDAQRVPNSHLGGGFCLFFLLGRLNPDLFPGRRTMKGWDVDRARARGAEQIARPLGLSVEAAARPGILALFDENPPLRAAGSGARQGLLAGRLRLFPATRRGPVACRPALTRTGSAYR